MAIPFATKNELKALDKKVDDAIASNSNRSNTVERPFYKHTIVFTGQTTSLFTGPFTVVVYTSCGEQLLTGSLEDNGQDLLTKVIRQSIVYKSIDFADKENYPYAWPEGFICQDINNKEAIVYFFKLHADGLGRTGEKVQNIIITSDTVE